MAFQIQFVFRSNKREAYTTFASCQNQNAARSNKVFFLCWVDYALEGSTANVILAGVLAACFTLRGHDSHIDLLWLLFLVGRIFPLMQAHFP